MHRGLSRGLRWGDWRCIDLRRGHSTAARAAAIEVQAVFLVANLSVSAVSMLEKSVGTAVLMAQSAMPKSHARSAGAASVAAARAAAATLEQTAAAARAAARTAAKGAESFDFAREPVNGSEGHARSPFDAARIVLRVMAARNRRGHHHVTCAVIKRERLARNCLVEQIGSGVKDWPADKS